MGFQRLRMVVVGAIIIISAGLFVQDPVFARPPIPPVPIFVPPPPGIVVIAPVPPGSRHSTTGTTGATVTTTIITIIGKRLRNHIYRR